MRRFIFPIVIVVLLAFSGGELQAGTVAAPVLKRDSHEPPERALTARSAIVVDRRSGKTLYTKNADEPRVPASLTKLMSAIIYLEQRPQFTEEIALTDSDEVGGGRLRLATGTVMTARDLFYSALVASANNAAMALMRISGLGSSEFVKEMNLRAGALGLRSTRYLDPTGMNPANITTARDTARLADYAFRNPTIRQVTQTGEYRFTTIAPTVEKRLRNTNALLLDAGNGLWITGGKTGYLEESGYNLAVTVKTMQKNKELVVVVLGAASKAKSFDEAKQLTRWAWDNYVWQR